MLSEQYNPDLDLLSQPCMCSPGLQFQGSVFRVQCLLQFQGSVFRVQCLLQYSVFNVQCSVFTSVFSV